MPGRASFHYRDPAAPEPNRPRRLSVLALIERDGALLLERRVDAPLWSLIGGGVEDDESLADALHREVREETGLAVAGFALFGTFTDPTRILAYPDGTVCRAASLVYRVAVESFDGLRASDESEELRFFPVPAVLGLDLPAPQLPILQRLVAGGPEPHLD